ncbi:MAG: ATP-binding protein [Elusimicrobiota bacterium]|jgi:PAS domain S-box-containing protein
MHASNIPPDNDSKPHKRAARTERAEADRALNNTIRFQQMLIDAIPSPVFYKDADCVYLGGNKAFSRFLGLPLDQIIGKTVYEIAPKDLAEKYDKADRALLNNPGVQTYEASVVYADGTRHAVVFNKATFTDADGKLAGMIGVILDITKRKQAEEALANMQKLESLGTLAGGIAHDFNNILTAIMGNLSLLQCSMKDGSEALEMIQEAQTACATAKGLSHQLLTFSKGGAPIVKVMDLRPILTQMAGLSTRGSNVRCVFDLGEIPLPVKIDKDQVSQVVQNLVLNAVQAMPQGGSISVRSSILSLGKEEFPPLKAGRYVRVRVEDQGIGIHPSHLSRVFEPYFTTKAAGRGLGLAMCYSIMTKHGGIISVESKLGTGSVFSLHFPEADAAELVPEDARPALTTGSGRVLIMDDEAPVAAVLKRMLEHLGYLADSVKDGKAALNAYKKALKTDKPYAAVIMDLTIPGGMGGMEAVKKLHALDPEAVAIVSSGYANDPVMSEYASHGFVGMLSKPYLLEDVSETVRRAIGAKTN